MPFATLPNFRTRAIDLLISISMSLLWYMEFSDARPGQTLAMLYIISACWYLGARRERVNFESEMAAGQSPEHTHFEMHAMDTVVKRASPIKHHRHGVYEKNVDVDTDEGNGNEVSILSDWGSVQDGMLMEFEEEGIDGDCDRDVEMGDEYENESDYGDESSLMEIMVQFVK